MHSNNNIEIFNRIVAVTLERLYSEFPIPIELKTVDIVQSATPDDASDELGFDCYNLTDETIDFLKSEGFITYSGTYLEGGTFLQARLTMKGLAILGYKFEENKSLISQIQSALSAGSKEIATETLKLVVQNAFTYALSAIPLIK